MTRSSPPRATDAPARVVATSEGARDVSPAEPARTHRAPARVEARSPCARAQGGARAGDRNSSRPIRARTSCGFPTASTRATRAPSPKALHRGGRRQVERARAHRRPRRRSRSPASRTRPPRSMRVLCARVPAAADDGRAARLRPEGPLHRRNALLLRRRERNDGARSTCRPNCATKSPASRSTSERTAGAVSLLNSRWKRRRVAIVSGRHRRSCAAAALAVLLCRRARWRPSPKCASRAPGTRDPIVAALDEQPSLHRADGRRRRSPGLRATGSHRFVEDGGVLLRFAGTRLASGADDDLTPVRLRRGGRVLGGSLSWETPRKLAPFDRASPLLRHRRQRGSRRHAAGSRRARGRPRRQDMGRARRRHAAHHRRPARQGPRRARPRHRRHHMVEPAAVGPVRERAAPHGRAGRRERRGRGERNVEHAGGAAARPRRWRPRARWTASACLGDPPVTAKPIARELRRPRRTPIIRPASTARPTRWSPINTLAPDAKLGPAELRRT